MEQALSKCWNSSHYCPSRHQVHARRESEVISLSRGLLFYYTSSQLPYPHWGLYTSVYLCSIQSSLAPQTPNVPCETSQSCHVGRNHGLHNSSSRNITWQCKHAIHIQTFHPPSPLLESAGIRQVARKIKNRTLLMQRAQVWHHKLFKSLYRRKTRRCTLAILRFPQPPALHCCQVYKCWVLHFVFTS